MITVKTAALNERMIKTGYTGAELSRATGITRGYISQMLNGKRSILPPTAKKICDALGCVFDDVFEIKERNDGESK